MPSPGHLQCVPEHHRQPLGAPGRKPLYLLADAQSTCDVVGGALVVRRAGAVIQRFPLTRVARVVCGNKATWTGQALAACLAEGVTITWVNGHGHALGNAQPRCAKPESLGALIETYLELPDWTSRFDNWRARRRLETLITSARRHAEEGRVQSARMFAERKRAFVHHGLFPEAFEPIGEAYCLALATDRLHKVGLQCRYHGFDGSLLDLGAELSALLWAELNFDAGSFANATDRPELLTRVFESWSHLREDRLLAHLGDLRRHVSREVDAWH